jgi:hypothetical protein
MDVMDKAMSKFRVGVMFGMMGIAVLGSVVAVFAGKRDRAAHVNSLAQRNRDRHANVEGKDV